jgi:hypothetical protein
MIFALTSTDCEELGITIDCVTSAMIGAMLFSFTELAAPGVPCNAVLVAQFCP